MRRSILEAVQDGDWDYEPTPCDRNQYTPTSARPGSVEKVNVLSDRVLRGLPLWHPSDPRFYEERGASSA